MDHATAPPAQTVAPAAAPAAAAPTYYPPPAGAPAATAYPASTGPTTPAAATDAYGHMADPPTYLNANVGPGGVQVAAGGGTPAVQVQGTGQAGLGPNGPQAGVTTTVTATPPNTVIRATGAADTQNGVSVAADAQHGTPDNGAGISANAQNLGTGQANGNGGATVALTTEELRLRGAAQVNGVGQNPTVNMQGQAAYNNGEGGQAAIHGQATDVGGAAPAWSVDASGQTPAGPGTLSVSGGAQQAPGGTPTGQGAVHYDVNSPIGPRLNTNLHVEGVGTPNPTGGAGVSAYVPLAPGVGLTADGGATVGGPNGPTAQGNVGVRANAGPVVIDANVGASADQTGVTPQGNVTATVPIP